MMRSSFTIKQLVIFDENYLPFDVKVVYEYEPADYSNHPYGEGTTPEFHSPMIDIISIKSTSVVTEIDENGDTIQESTSVDVMKIKGWDKKVLGWFEQEALKDAGL